ncbi:hypothetical protein Tco_0176864 [Tanacetum coccineum]
MSKPPRDKNQREFVEGSWSYSGEENDEKIQDETCLVAQAPNEVGIKQKPQEKRLKPGKHEHKNGRAHKKPGGSYQSQKVKPSVNLVKLSQSHNKTKFPKLPNSPS